MHRLQPALAVRPHAFWRWVLRAVLLAFALQLSGAVHTVHDVFESGHEIQADHEGGQEHEDRCPPGCPACHCSQHSSVGSVPGRLLEVAFSPPALRLCLPRAVDSPDDGPALSGPYRPPRTPAVARG